MEVSKNRLIAMLEELVSKDDTETKKKKLSEKYDLVMDYSLERRVSSMCNFSEALIERGREEGREEGILAMIQDNLEMGLEKEKILEKTMRFFSVTWENALKYYSQVATE